jgi:hypothetical protein
MQDQPSALSEARRLRAEASRLIEGSGLDAVLRRHGEARFTGSYRLDLMAWRDLDIEIVMRPEEESVGAFFRLGGEIAALPGVRSLKFNNGVSFRLWEEAPRGLYWGMRLLEPDTQATWKVDLWAFRAELAESHLRETEEIIARLDQATRELIVETKRALLTPEGRTPVFSGYQIYRAVLYEGLRQREEIVAYLRAHGVEGV